MGDESKPEVLRLQEKHGAHHGDGGSLEHVPGLAGITQAFAPAWIGKSLDANEKETDPRPPVRSECHDGGTTIEGPVGLVVERLARGDNS